MTHGVVAQLKELIDLRRYATSKQYRPIGRAGMNGNKLTKLRGRGMDFAEVRNYQAGDEIRHMEWRVTARTGKPHVKLYEEERERPVVIMVDFSPSMYFGTQVAFKSVIAARLAALISWLAVKQGDRVGGLLFSAMEHNEFHPRARSEGIIAFLAAISAYTQKFQKYQHEVTQNGAYLAQALQRVRRVTKPGSILVIISDFYSFDLICEEHLNRLKLHNEIFAYHILDNIELSAPSLPQQYPISNGKQFFLLDTSVTSVTQAYQNFCQERINNLLAKFKSLQIPYFQVAKLKDNSCLAELVRKTFPRSLSHA